MRYRRVFALALVATLAVEPAAAQSVNRNLIEGLNYQLLYVALPLTLFVEIILVYAVFRFRDNDDPEPTTDDAALEITWTVATAIILLFVGVSAYSVLASPYISPQQGEAEGFSDDPVEVRVLAYQWGWEFSYPGANVTTQAQLVVPANRDVELVMTSSDVIHSLFVPKLGVKQDVFPGKTTRIRTRATATGRYRAYCTELCGAGHARMRATVTVLEPAAYRGWLESNRGNQSVTAAPRPSDGDAPENPPPRQI